MLVGACDVVFVALGRHKDELGCGQCVLLEDGRGGSGHGGGWRRPTVKPRVLKYISGCWQHEVGVKKENKVKQRSRAVSS